MSLLYYVLKIRHHLAKDCEKERTYSGTLFAEYKCRSINQIGLGNIRHEQYIYTYPTNELDKLKTYFL